MKTQTKLIMALAVAGAIALSGAGYVAYRSTAGRCFARDKIVPKLCALGLTHEQKTQVRGILKNHRSSMRPLVGQLVAERRALRDLIHAESVDETAIRAQVEKVAKVDADLAVQRANIAHEIRGLLTTEQIQKLKELKVSLDAHIDRHLARIAKRLQKD